MAKLIPCLVLLRATFDDLFPGRDHTSDGWIGDSRHQAEKSDHNPDSRGLVHAIDVDADLGPGITMHDVVTTLVARCHAGAEKRLTYVIYDRQIASASHGWTWRAYDGKSPHTEHAHFSASNAPALEQNTTSWHLEEVPVALTADDKKWIEDLFARGQQPDNGGITSKIGRDALDQGVPNPIRGGKTTAWQLLADIAAAVKPPAA